MSVFTAQRLDARDEVFEEELGSGAVCEPESFEPAKEETVPVEAERALLALVTDEAYATPAHTEAQEREADCFGVGADGEPVDFRSEHGVSIFLTPALFCSELMNVGTVSAPLRTLVFPLCVAQVACFDKRISTLSPSASATPLSEGS